MNINTMITQEEYLAMSSMLGESATINGTAATIIVGSSKPNEHYDAKTIRTLTPLACGDLITHKEKSWLVISEVAGDRHTIYRGLMRVCPFQVNITTGTEQVLIGYDPIGKPVYETQNAYTALPAIIDSRTFGIDQGQINIATGQMLITLQENETSLLVGLNDRFTKFNSAWIVSGIDRTCKGLITLTVDKTESSPSDPPDPDAPAPPPPPPAPEIAVTGANDLLYNNTATYAATVTVNGVTDTTVPVVWSLFADDQSSTTAAAEFSPAPTTAQTCTLKGKTNTVTYVQLKCALQSDTTAVAWKRIRCKSLM